jgi:hypothetical protein
MKEFCNSASGRRSSLNAADIEGIEGIEGIEKGLAVMMTTRNASVRMVIHYRHCVTSRVSSMKSWHAFLTSARSHMHFFASSFPLFCFRHVFNCFQMCCFYKPEPPGGSGAKKNLTWVIVGWPANFSKIWHCHVTRLRFVTSSVRPPYILKWKGGLIRLTDCRAESQGRPHSVLCHTVSMLRISQGSKHIVGERHVEILFLIT